MNSAGGFLSRQTQFDECEGDCDSNRQDKTSKKQFAKIVEIRTVSFLNEAHTKEPEVIERNRDCYYHDIDPFMFLS